MKPIGLLLAAGRGHRMGGNKQFHLVQTSAGEKPLVAAAFDTIAPVCEKMFVVLGHRAEEVATTLKMGSELFSHGENSSDPSEIVSVDPDAPMFNSIQSGLSAVLAADPAANTLLQLGDHPVVTPSTLEKLLVVAQANPGKAIMPTYDDKGGHPVLIPATIAEKILASDCSGGLRQFWLEHAELCVRFAVDDAGVTQDIDTLP